MPKLSVTHVPLQKRHLSNLIAPPTLGRDTLFFYLDRFLRIAPQYIFFLILTQLCLFQFQFRFWNYFIYGENSFFIFMLNALIVPVNYAMFYQPLEHHTLIFPAWSLGLEEQFYWIFPFFVLKNWTARVGTLLSVAVFVAAMTQYIDHEVYGYRVLPGVLFIFMMGKSLADFKVFGKRESLWTLILLYFSCVFTQAYLYLVNLQSKTDRDILWGILVGAPLIWGLSLLPRRKWDDLIGNASYGVFLSHFLVINVLLHFRALSRNPFISAIESILFSTVAGICSYYLVEKVVNGFRFRLRTAQLSSHSENLKESLASSTAYSSLSS